MNIIIHGKLLEKNKIFFKSCTKFYKNIGKVGKENIVRFKIAWLKICCSEN